MAVKMGVAVVVSAVDRVTGPLHRMGNRAAAVSNRINRYSRDLNTMLKPIAQVAKVAGIAATAATYAAVRMGKAWLDAAGNLQDFGAQIGWRVEDIQAWRYAAGQAGVSSGNFDKAIQRMSKNIAELRTGSGELHSMLTRVGDTEFMEQLKNAKGAEALDLIIRKMSMLEDQEAATLLATQAFGRSGLVMTGLAAQGSEALDRLRQYAYDTGQVMSQDTANAADDLGDKIVSLKGILGGFANTAMSRAIPALTALVDRMTKWLENNRELVRVKIEQFIDRLFAAFDRLGAWMDKHGDDVADTIKKIANFASDAIDAVGGIQNAIGILASVYLGTQLLGAIDVATKAFTALAAHPALAAVMAAFAAAKWLESTLEGSTRSYVQQEAQYSGARAFTDADAARRFAQQEQARRVDAFARTQANATALANLGQVDVNVNLNGLPEGTTTSTMFGGTAVGKVEVANNGPAGRRKVGR